MLFDNVRVSWRSFLRILLIELGYIFFVLSFLPSFLVDQYFVLCIGESNLRRRRKEEIFISIVYGF